MATIVVDTDNTPVGTRLSLAPSILTGSTCRDSCNKVEPCRNKGVKRVCLEEDISYPKLDKSISDTKSGKNVRCKNVTELMQSLKYRTRHCEPEG